MDLCPARYLPVVADGAELNALRYLVAIGPSEFDFASDAGAGRTPVAEYFQFLRGAGKHPLGSSLQLADSFSRLFFEPTPRGSNGAYTLAASWFPAPAVAVAPPPCTALKPPSGPVVERGLCDVLRSGTAASLQRRLKDPRIVLYGAKTGTVDSLGDVLAGGMGSCRTFNAKHTLPAGADVGHGGGQPYHLPCGSRDQSKLNDGLFVIAFGVRSGGTVTPFTLALEFQRVGHSRMAVRAAEFFMEAVANYWAS